jgi:general secretion pathway protein I
VSGRVSRGFTLIEILIALTVLAVAMGAIIKAATDYTGGLSHLRDRTMANWVARNVLNELQMQGEWPSVGQRKGDMEMGYYEWRWLARISQTEEPELRRLDIEVLRPEDDPDSAVSVLSGFLRKPD